MKLALKYILLFCILYPHLIIAQNSRVQFKHLSADDGLSNNQVYTILQDHKGFMWFGTEDGLNKYDGTGFTIYRNNVADSLSLSYNNVKQIFEDSDQNLWIATFGGGLNLYNRDKDNFTIFRAKPEDPFSLVNNYVNEVYEDRNKDLWLGTPNGINKFDKKTQKFYRYAHNPADPSSLSHDGVETIYEDMKGNLWVGTNEGLNLMDRETGKFKKYLHEPGNSQSLSHNHITEITEDKDGNLWVGTRWGGLNLFDYENQTFTHFRHNSQDPSSLGNDVIYELCLNRKGNLWIGTESGGANLYHPSAGTFTRYSNDYADKSSLSNGAVSSIFEDSSGTLWIATGEGVSYYNPVQQKFEVYRSNIQTNSISNNNIKGLCEGENGDIWIATDGGGLNKFNRKGKTFTSYLPVPGNEKSLSSASLLTVFHDSKGNIWTGSYDGGLNKFNREDQTFQKFVNHPEDSLSLGNNSIRSLMEDSKGNIWIGTNGGGINRYDPKTGNFRRYACGGAAADRVASCWVNNIMEDSDGLIWIATSWGLNTFNPQTNTFSHFEANGKAGSLSNNDVYDVFEDSKKRVWVATKDGLNLFESKSASFKVFRESDGLPVSSVTSINEDLKGNLWLGTLKGLSRFNPESLTFRNFTTSEGIQGDEFGFGSTLRTKNEDLLFGGTKGLNIFHPDSLKDNEFIPPVYFTSFSIFNKPVETGEESFLKKHINETKEITLSYLESVISFEFAALNFINSENNQYAYMLEGFDKDWSYIGNKRSATYTNLDPGSYTLRVKASNNDGVWNQEGTALSIIITPPYWKTWWFRTILGLSLIGGAFTFYQVRMNAVRAQKEELERQVQEKTADIQKANTDLTERQEEILQQQEELQAQAEILQQTNDNLRETQDEIAVQRDHLKIVNEQVMSSIQYARTIQKAILPSIQKITQVFPEHFIIYRPKDVVSGDFYWFSHLLKEDSGLKTDLTFMAVVDCTGHGVPGAFMSIIGSTILNEVVNQKQITDPAQVLEHLDAGVKQAVEKSEGVNTAGMDVCLCRFEKIPEQQEVKVLFSGAKRNLVYIKAGTNEPEKLEADRRSIGSESVTPFTTQELLLPRGSMLYLTSDGYADQNNTAREKLGSRNTKLLIAELSALPVSDQKKHLESALDSHQQNAEQRDDITFIGLKL